MYQLLRPPVCHSVVRTLQQIQKINFELCFQVNDLACLDLSVSSSSWGLGRAAVCNCGTTWTSLLPFLPIFRPLRKNLSDSVIVYDIEVT